MAVSPATSKFLAKLLAIEEAWTLLDAVEHADDKVAAIDRAMAIGGHSSQLLIRAGKMLASLGRAEDARRALERGIDLGGPTAPLQAALAHQLRAMGDLEAAAHWLRGAMLRARPDARLVATLAVVELEAGHAGCAEAIMAAAQRFPTNDAAGLVEQGRCMSRLGRPDLAVAPFVLAYARGYREDSFVADFGTLLSRDDVPLIDAEIQHAAAARAAHLKLSAYYRNDPIIAAVQAREASADWLDVGATARLLASVIARAEPFSWIRLGDGEGRFLLWQHEKLRGSLGPREAELVGRTIWRNWFGDVGSDRHPAGLAARLDAAIANAGLLGLTTAARLAVEREHFGSLIALERHVADVAPHAGRPMGDALAAITLNERDPFYAKLLVGLDMLGVISPHPDLATRLGRQLGITHVLAHVIPGESRLGLAALSGKAEPHFPDGFSRVMKEIEVPRRGTVYLVAGGLLGKIYCDRIRELGGIALDIGAVADAWMGYNTRGVVLDQSMRHRLTS